MALAINPNRVKLLKICKHITEKEFKQMKLLCKECIPAGELEKLTSVCDLFDKIEKLSKTKEESVRFISELLEHIDRIELVDELNGNSKSEKYGSSIQSKGKLEISATAKKDKSDSKDDCSSIDNDVRLLITDRITKDWRRFGLCLMLEVHVLEGIEADFRLVSDKTNAVLRAWEKQKNATMEQLMTALEKITRQDIIREIKTLKNHNEDVTMPTPVQETDDIKPEGDKSTKEEEDVIAGMERIEISDTRPTVQEASESTDVLLARCHPRIYTVVGENLTRNDCNKIIRHFDEKNIGDSYHNAGETLLEKLEGKHPDLTLGEFFSVLREEDCNNAIKKIHDLLHGQ